MGMILAGLTLTFGRVCPPAVAQGDPPVVTPLASDATASGLSLDQWAAAWHQWILSIPNKSTPLNDPTGQFASVGQKMPVWFLTSDAYAVPRIEEITFKATIPAEQSIFVCVQWALAYGDSIPSKNQIRSGSGLNTLPVPAVEVDGVSIPDMSKYRLQTPGFTLVLPPDNVLNENVTKGTSKTFKAIADGYWLLLPPLPKGKHTIHVQKEWPAGAVSETFALTIK